MSSHTASSPSIGYISKEVYEDHIKKYSQPLSAKEESTPHEQEKSQFLKDKDKQLKGMLESWDLEHLNPNWHEKAVAEAKKFPDLEYAKLLIAKGKKDCDISQEETEP